MIRKATLIERIAGFLVLAVLIYVHRWPVRAFLEVTRNETRIDESLGYSLLCIWGCVTVLALGLVILISWIFLVVWAILWVVWAVSDGRIFEATVEDDDRRSLEKQP
jgi:uncharacterized membrane protein